MRIQGQILDSEESRRNYKTLREFPVNTMFVAKALLRKVSCGFFLWNLKPT